jgi:hypothetical protein
MPDWKTEIRARLQSLQLTPTREAAIVEELAQDLDDCYAESLSSGVTKAEAYQQTLAELSESELLQRELRRVERQITQEPIVLGSIRGTYMITDLWQYLRYGARMLLKKPRKPSPATVTLTALFSYVIFAGDRLLAINKRQQSAASREVFMGFKAQLQHSPTVPNLDRGGGLQSPRNMASSLHLVSIWCLFLESRRWILEQ